MFRPATPLSIIFFVAFVLLLLSTISTPVIKAIPLGSFQGYDFGVLGYCKGNTCSSPHIGYSTDGLFTGNTADDFSLPSSTRNSLSSILIVHPVAALLCLICFALAVAAHFHGPSHSPRYLLALLILTIPTLLVTLLAFLVDILLFVPHVQWGGWIVLAATILIVASSVVTCAMRRTLVSRKARKKRIAENADMNGANYYSNLNETRMMTDSAQLPRADSPPPMSGSTAVDGKGGVNQFATFEMKRPETATQDGGRRSMDDRTPLNPTRDPSIRSASTGGAGRRPYDPTEAPPMPMNGGGRPSFDSQGAPTRPSRDEYGNPISPAAMAMAGGLPPPGLRHHSSRGSLGSDRSGGSREGMPTPGYGRGAPGRGGYGPRGGFRGGPPPPGWNGRGRGSYGPPGRGFGPPRGGYAQPRGGSYGPGGPGGFAPVQGRMPPTYANDAGNPYGPSSPTGMQPQQPLQDEFVARGPSPGPNSMPIGQAIEMDERTGSPPGPGPMSPVDGFRDSDADVAGMVGLQQNRMGNNSPMRQASPMGAHGGQMGRNSPMRRESERSTGSGFRSPTSDYSDQTYVPPRSAWAQPAPLQNPHAGPTSPMTMDTSSSSQPMSSGAMPSSNALPLSPIQASPTSPPQGPRHARAGSEPYYEDVDPRFADDQGHHFAVQAPTDVDGGADQHTALPSSLTPGASHGFHSHPMSSMAAGYRTHSPNHLAPGAFQGQHADAGHSTPSLERENSSYENLPEGARSPAEGSETSHFTSVSQRGINPNWRPSGTFGASSVGAPSSASAAQRRREDVVLAANPDFSLPGVGIGGRGGRGRGRGGTMRGYGPPMGAPGGLTPQGRYPTDI